MRRLEEQEHAQALGPRPRAGHVGLVAVQKCLGTATAQTRPDFARHSPLPDNLFPHASCHERRSHTCLFTQLHYVSLCKGCVGLSCYVEVCKQHVHNTCFILRGHSLRPTRPREDLLVHPSRKRYRAVQMALLIHRLDMLRLWGAPSTSGCDVTPVASHLWRARNPRVLWSPTANLDDPCDSGG